jgi:hypothetical protein
MERGLHEYKMWVLISTGLRALTPHPWSLSALRGEGAAIAHRRYSFVKRHSYDVVQRSDEPYLAGNPGRLNRVQVFRAQIFRFDG